MNGNLNNDQAGLARAWLIVIIIVSAVVVGGIGYVIGGNMKEADLKNQYEDQVQSLQSDLDGARGTASDELEEGQEAIEEGQQTLESLQAENTQLKATIEEQNQKIADLEQQLEEANEATPPAQN